MNRKEREYIKIFLKVDRFKSRFILILTCIFVFLFAGMTMNTIAVHYNDNKMPVYEKSIPFEYIILEGPEHFIFENKEDVNYFYFTDIINVANKAIVSFGDISMLIAALFGLYLAIFLIMNYKILIEHRKLIRYMINNNVYKGE